jgi:hypothetical protein
MMINEEKADYVKIFAGFCCWASARQWFFADGSFEMILWLIYIIANEILSAIRSDFPVFGISRPR